MFKDFNYYYSIKQNNINYQDKNLLIFKEGFNKQFAFKLFQITMSKRKNQNQNILKKQLNKINGTETIKKMKTQF